MSNGGTVGHRKTLNGERKEFLYNNGCYLHDDCFTCPFPDCQNYATGKDEMIRQIKLLITDPEEQAERIRRVTNG